MNFVLYASLSGRALIWQQGALTRVEKTLSSFPPAGLLGTGFPPKEARRKEGSDFTTSLAARLELCSPVSPTPELGVFQDTGYHAGD